MGSPEGGVLRKSWTRISRHKSELAFVLGVFVISLVIRWNDLSALAAYPDELTYVLRSIHIVGTNWTWPLSDMWDQPPLFTYVLAVIVASVGGTLDSLRLVSVVAGAVTVVIVYLLGKSMYGRPAGVVASLAMAVDGFDILYSRLLYIESLACMLILASVLLFYEGLVKKKSLGLAAAGGFFFGLALDSKYISMVLGVGFLLFLLIYRKKFSGGFPGKQALFFFGIGLLVLVPVVLDLALNNANPLYYDLEYRFQLGKVSALVGQVQSGQALIGGFTRFVQVFFHVSSTNPFQVFPALVLDIPIWTALVVAGGVFFAASFLLRRNVADGLLLVIFVLFLAFAFSYPGKRVYFSLYPSLVFFVMLGRIAQLAYENLSGLGNQRMTNQVLAVSILALTVGGVTINAFSVPVMYTNGFGDWDEMYPIMDYISHNSGNDTYVATTLAEIGFYVKEYGINATLIGLKQPASLYSEPVANQTLLTATSGQYPIYWVISPSAIEKMHPQFVVIPRDDYLLTDNAFRQFLNQGYYQPLDTKLILLFQIRPGNQTFAG